MNIYLCFSCLLFIDHSLTKVNRFMGLIGGTCYVQDLPGAPTLWPVHTNRRAHQERHGHRQTPQAATCRSGSTTTKKKREAYRGFSKTRILNKSACLLVCSPYFWPWLPEFAIFELIIEFLIKNCMYVTPSVYGKTPTIKFSIAFLRLVFLHMGCFYDMGF